MENWLMIMLNEEKREVYIYDMIGPAFFGMDSGDALVEALNTLGPGPLSVRINSPGGDVFQGYAMFNALERHDGTVTTHNDGLVASAATFPYLAGSVRKAGKLSQVMIHEASTVAVGNAADLEKAAGLLRDINDQLADLYAGVSGKDKGEILDLMAAETWMNTATATEFGFVTGEDTTKPEKEPDLRIVPKDMYRNTPAAYLKPEILVKAIKHRPLPDPYDAERKQRIFDLTGVDLRVK